MYSRMSALVFLLALATRPSPAQVPMGCASHAHILSETCCPAWAGDGSACGHASDRGMCGNYTLPAAASLPRGVEPDFRWRWPTQFFTAVCLCWGNFWGADCGECRPGWVGKRCRRAQRPVRRPDCMEMSDAERVRLVAALQTAKTTISRRWAVYGSLGGGRWGPKGFRNATVFDVMVWEHYLTAKAPAGAGDSSRLYAHRSIGFLSWHRLYLLWFERELRILTKNEELALCAWKWAGAKSCQVCTPDFFGGSDGHGFLMGNFANWSVPCNTPASLLPDMSVICPPGGFGRITRMSAGQRVGLPTAADRRRCMAMDRFDTQPYDVDSLDSFRNTLEGFINPNGPGVGMHNRVHQFLGGLMNSVFLAPADPVFLPVHVELDRLLEMWLAKKGYNVSYPADHLLPEGHRAKDYILPFIPLYTNKELLKPSENFGYTYD